jgi:hypothetical protein
MSNDFGPHWTMDTQEYGSYLMIGLFFLLIPVLPAGDLAITVLKKVDGVPNIVYILGWLGAVVGYGYLLMLVVHSVLDEFGTFGKVTFLYGQGIVFSIILAKSGVVGASSLIAGLALRILGFLFSTN